MTGKIKTVHQRNKEQAAPLSISNSKSKEGEHSHSTVNPGNLHQPPQRKPESRLHRRHAGTHALAGQAGGHTARGRGGRIPRTMPPF